MFDTALFKDKQTLLLARQGLVIGARKSVSALFWETIEKFVGKTEREVQGMPIALVQMREVGRLFDPNFSFILATTAADKLGTANRVDCNWTKAGL